MYVSSARLTQLSAEDFVSSQWIIVIFWSALSTSAGDTRTPPGDDGGPQPPLPPPDYPPAIWTPPRPVLIEEPNSDRLFPQLLRPWELQRGLLQTICPRTTLR